VEICAFAAEQRFHRACSISVAIAKIINVTRRARSFASPSFARLELQPFLSALKSFSKIRFSFSHKFAAAATAGMTKRQTKFRRRDVNDAEQKQTDVRFASEETVVAGVSPAESASQPTRLPLQNLRQSGG
jgi:hypothetical protein